MPGAAALVGAVHLENLARLLLSLDSVPSLGVDLAVVRAVALGWLIGWVFSELLLPLLLLTPRISLAPVPEQGLSRGVLPSAICSLIHDLLEFLDRPLCWAETFAAHGEMADEAFVCHFGLRIDPLEAASAPLCHAQRSIGVLRPPVRGRRIPGNP